MIHVPPREIDDSTPLRLAVAAEIAFPDGSMTGRKLAHAASAGRLDVEIIGGKTYTTLGYIKTMRERSRVKATAQRPDVLTTPSDDLMRLRATASKLKQREAIRS